MLLPLSLFDCLLLANNSTTLSRDLLERLKALPADALGSLCRQAWNRVIGNARDRTLLADPNTSSELYEFKCMKELIWSDWFRYKEIAVNNIGASTKLIFNVLFHVVESSPYGFSQVLVMLDRLEDQIHFDDTLNEVCFTLFLEWSRNSKKHIYWPVLMFHQMLWKRALGNRNVMMESADLYQCSHYYLTFVLFSPNDDNSINSINNNNIEKTKSSNVQMSNSPQIGNPLCDEESSHFYFFGWGNNQSGKSLPNSLLSRFPMKCIVQCWLAFDFAIPASPRLFQTLQLEDEEFALCCASLIDSPNKTHTIVTGNNAQNSASDNHDDHDDKLNLAVAQKVEKRTIELPPRSPVKRLKQLQQQSLNVNWDDRNQSLMYMLSNGGVFQTNLGHNLLFNSMVASLLASPSSSLSSVVDDEKFRSTVDRLFADSRFISNYTIEILLFAHNNRQDGGSSLLRILKSLPIEEYFGGSTKNSVVRDNILSFIRTLSLEYMELILPSSSDAPQICMLVVDILLRIKFPGEEGETKEITSENTWITERLLLDWQTRSLLLYTLMNGVSDQSFETCPFIMEWIRMFINIVIRHFSMRLDIILESFCLVSLLASRDPIRILFLQNVRELLNDRNLSSSSSSSSNSNNNKSDNNKDDRGTTFLKQSSSSSFSIKNCIDFICDPIILSHLSEFLNLAWIGNTNIELNPFIKEKLAEAFSKRSTTTNNSSTYHLHYRDSCWIEYVKEKIKLNYY